MPTDSGSMIAAMKKYMQHVTDRIDYGRSNVEPFEKRLTDRYAEWKKKQTGGWAYPIGKLTAQLLDNLNPDGLGGRNIRLKK